jgi:dTDP-4-dehydrorhamnose 3,5-epimerase
MEVRQTGIDGLVEIIPALYQDDRGWFCEFYRADRFEAGGIRYNFVQDNHSFSRKGVVRGLHFQLPPYGQAKLVSVITGRILDVVVDIRQGSKTFGRVHYCILDAQKHNMLMVPEGFGHGFAALEDSIFLYKCSNRHHKESERGIVWNDPGLNIDWQVSDPVISEKDRGLPTLDELMRKSVISQH